MALLPKRMKYLASSSFLFKKGGEVVGVYKRFFRDVRHGDFFAEVIVDVFDGVSYHL